MNVLFYTTYKASATKGGVERSTISLAGSLKSEFGCKCFSAFHIGADTPMENCFESEYHWSNNWNKKGLRRYCYENKIDCIINQGELSVTKNLRKIADNLSCKLLFVHHFEPGFESHFLTFHDCISDFKSANYSRKIKVILKLMLFPYLRVKYLFSLRKKYRKAYFYSDIVVLLCNGYISQFASYGRIHDNKKFIVIPNALSYNGFIKEGLLLKKKPIILIVSRLEESPKRLSLALNIWKEVKKYADSKGWQLNIIGHGGDGMMYQKMIKDLGLQDVHLLGRQQPKKYYEEASIFIMTSKSEGFPLTLLEAQQFGVVPLAFNTFASLCDIIRDGDNGYIIPESDIPAYVARIIQLIRENALREKMAVQAIQNSKRFSSEIITKMWWSVINEVA